MAGSLSDYAEAKVLELLVGKTAFATPTVYIALCTADPTDAGSGATITEPVGSAYARKSTAGADWEAGASPGGTIQNANAITFVEASGSWGTITHFALLDSGVAAEGNMIAHGDLAVQKAVSSGDTVSFAAGALDISLA